MKLSSDVLGNLTFFSTAFSQKLNIAWTPSPTTGSISVFKGLIWRKSGLTVKKPPYPEFSKTLVVYWAFATQLFNIRGKEQQKIKITSLFDHFKKAFLGIKELDNVDVDQFADILRSQPFSRANVTEIEVTIQTQVYELGLQHDTGQIVKIVQDIDKNQLIWLDLINNKKL